MPLERRCHTLERRSLADDYAAERAATPAAP